MKSLILLILLPLLLATTTMAADVPVSEDTKNKGYAEYPVLQCPKTSDQMKNILKRVNTLKDSIKKDANCKSTEDDTIAGTKKLSALVGDQRKEFLALMQKGQSEGLNDQEQNKIQTYVSNLMTTTDTLVKVLTGNDGCFKEDKKASSLSFITSLIGESSKILSLIGGPAIAGTVAIASNVVTGFLEGMKSIQENRVGFRFDQYEQREAYSESLCSLFEYKKEMRSFLFPQNTIQSLKKLSSTLAKQLEILMANCPECNEIASRVKSLESAGKPRSEIWSKSFEEDIKRLAAEINKKYVRPLGTHTYRSLRTTAWINERIAALNDNTIQADLGLQQVVTQIADIETFMVEQQSSTFFYYQIEDARKNYDELLARMSGISGRLLRELNQPFPPLKSKSAYFVGDTNASESYMIGLNDAYDLVDRIGRARIEALVEQIDSSMSKAVVSAGVIDRYCSFFLNARWFNRTIERECENPSYKQLRKNIYTLLDHRLLLSTIPPAADLERTMSADENNILPATAAPMTVPGGSIQSDTAPPTIVKQGPKVSAKQKKLAADWTESLEKMVDDWTKNPEYIRRSIP